jgi:tRNA-specific 2-thiouridylase
LKVALLISGGVDSSVALHLLKQQGFDVHAFYLKIWLEDELSFLGDCPWEEDLKYAEQITTSVNVPLTVLPFQKQYHERIVQYTLDEVRVGRTPNPDVLCNSRIKFGAFLEAIGNDYELVATGHYARTEKRNNLTYLRMAKDTFKDQTYFLSHLTQEQVSRLIFPVGDYLKSEVRQLAQDFDLPNKDRKDSQGICFLGKIEFKDFLKYHLGERTGDLVESETGKKVGEHEGYWYYTIGQRKGIKLSGGPWYVVKKDIPTNTVYVSSKVDASTGTSNSFVIREPHWIAREPQGGDLRVKIRHGERTIGCSLEHGNGLRVLLQEPDYIADGQFAAFYEGDHCLGGGVISV